MNLWSVEHFLTISFIKIRFSCNQNIEEKLIQCLSSVLITGKSNFGEKMVKKYSTDQRFILIEISSWKIHTLKTFLYQFICTAYNELNIILTYSEVPNGRACLLRFFRFSFPLLAIFHVINEKFHPACLFTK